MRISDWSSDVCSSDLITINDGGIGEKTRAKNMVPSKGCHSIPPIEPKSPFIAKNILPYVPRKINTIAIIELVVAFQVKVIRSEESRVGKECVSTGRSRW